MKSFPFQAVFYWVIFALSTQAYAFVKPSKSTSNKTQLEKHAPAEQVIRPQLTKTMSLRDSKFKSSSSIQEAHIALDKNTGELRVISGNFSNLHGPLTKNSPNEDYITAAMSFIFGNPSFFPNLTEVNLRLDKKSTLRDGEHQFFKFRVYRNDRLIQGAMIDFRFKHGKLVQIANNSFSEANAVLTKTKTNIYQIVKDASKSDHLSHKGSVYRVVQNQKKYELVSVERFISIENGIPFEIHAISETAEIFEKKSLNHYISGNASGSIYQRSWQESRVNLPFSDLNISLTDDAIATTNNQGAFDAGESTEVSVSGLAGPLVKVTAVTGTPVSQSASIDEAGLLTLNISAEEGENAYEGKDTAQSMIFYHANKIIQHAKKYIDTPWFSSQLPANANLADTCNAHWSSLAGNVNFYSAGNNCANTGLISDVIYHEWGHGFDHNTGGIEDGAFSEGIGDIMSLVMTHSPILGTGFRLNGDPVRNLEEDKIYPQDAGGGVHSEGLVIGSTFYDLFQELSKVHGEEIAGDLISRYAFKMLPTASKYTDVYDALLVIDDDDADLNNGTPNTCIISQTFKKHGLAELHPNCYLGTKDGVETTQLQGNDNGIVEPGETFSISLSVHNDSSINIVDMAAIASIEGNDKVSISNNPLAWSTIPVGQSLASSNQVEMVIADDAVCGSSFKVVFAQKSATRTGSLDHSFTLGSHKGTDVKFAVADLPAPIPDKSSVEFEIENNTDIWQADTTVRTAHVKFDITHTYRGDITVYLTSPDGIKTKIHKGSGADDDIHFDEDVSSLLKGKKGKGKWILEVKDALANDTGYLDSFELTLNPNIYHCE